MFLGESFWLGALSCQSCQIAHLSGLVWFGSVAFGMAAVREAAARCAASVTKSQRATHL